MRAAMMLEVGEIEGDESAGQPCAEPKRERPEQDVAERRVHAA